MNGGVVYPIIEMITVVAQLPCILKSNDNGTAGSQHMLVCGVGSMWTEYSFVITI